MSDVPPEISGTDANIRFAEGVDIFHQMALMQIDAWQFFSMPRIDGFRDLNGLDLFDYIGNLGSTCKFQPSLAYRQVMEYFAIVSRRPYQQSFVNGRSATEFIWEKSFQFMALLSNTVHGRPNFLRADFPTEQERKILAAIMPVVFEACRNSGSFLTYQQCEEFRAEIRWEAAKAIDKAREDDTKSTEIDFSDRQNDILDTLFDLKAFSPDAKQSTTTIAERIGVDPAALKEPIAKLVNRKDDIVHSKTGRSEGFGWANGVVSTLRELENSSYRFLPFLAKR